MYFKMTVANLTEKDADFLKKQFKGKNCKVQQDKYGWSIIEAEDTFENCMVLLAIGMIFPDYSATFSTIGGGFNVEKVEEKEESNQRCSSSSLAEELLGQGLVQIAQES